MVLQAGGRLGLGIYVNLQGSEFGNEIRQADINIDNAMSWFADRVEPRIFKPAKERAIYDCITCKLIVDTMDARSFEIVDALYDEQYQSRNCVLANSEYNFYKRNQLVETPATRDMLFQEPLEITEVSSSRKGHCNRSKKIPDTHLSVLAALGQDGLGGTSIAHFYMS
jgi:hypothetical protein